MFELLSARSDVDHPICSDCTELLLTSMQGHLAASLKERDAYIGFLKDIKSHSLTDAEIAKIAEDIANTRDSEQKAQAELLDLEGDKARLENELAELDAASRELDMVEEAFWRSRNQFDQTLSSVKDTCDALNAYISHDIQQLDRLERTNVYNDTFFISHDGPFGTINGLRLGRLPPPNNVEWPEINAAWGSTALLIATVADRIGLTFQGYRLRPMGSTSRIERLDGVTPPVMPDVAASDNKGRTKLTVLDLFSSGDLPLGRQILHRRFNEAMVAFLECLRQLCDHIRSTLDRSPRAEAIALPPYRIDKDKINGVSIKLG
ncbi:MAG: autophagy protein 6, partial [Stictis urceolatum]|nr:autophagy protein 6 [Stictis urceolata]